MGILFSSYLEKVPKRKRKGSSDGVSPSLSFINLLLIL